MTGSPRTEFGIQRLETAASTIREALERIIPPNEPDCDCGPCADARAGLAALDLLVAERNRSELDRRYCEVAAQRCAQDVLDLGDAA